MAVIELNLRPEPSQVRWFGALWLPGLLLVAASLALVRWNAPALGWTLLAVALVCEVAAWVAPSLVRLLLVAANVLTWPMAWLTNHALLAVLYFGLISPVGLLLRALGRDRLMVMDARSHSYWTPREPTRSVDRYFRPY